jgi:alanyl-tRNA synthetase
MDKGIDILAAEIEALKKSGGKTLSGDVAFKLYDTFGFPVEITEEILKEQKLAIDGEGFRKNMETQRDAAKKAWKGVNISAADTVPEEIIKNTPATNFVGYDVFEEAGCRVLAVVRDKKRTASAEKGQQAQVILDKTPCYGEGGGQVGDQGTLTADGVSADITDTQKSDNRFVHTIKVAKGIIKEGDLLKVSVNRESRAAIMKNHSGTHLLQAALRNILGAHVEQAGSYVGPDRLRFDFTHFAPLTDDEVRRTEKMVNIWAQESMLVTVQVMTVGEAKKTGAMALFEEKYKGDVRVVSMGTVSKELCAGTHLKNTGEIGLFKIISASSTAAGIRRIEAVTGEVSYEMAVENEDFIRYMKEIFKTSVLRELGEKVSRLIKDNKELEKKVGEVKKAGIMKDMDEYIKAAVDVDGVKVITLRFDNVEKEAVRQLGDVLREKVKRSVIVIASVTEGRISFLSMVTDDLTDRLDASKIVKQVAAVCGGGGGGKKNMAEAGGRDVSKIDEALLTVVKAVKG